MEAIDGLKRRPAVWTVFTLLVGIGVLVGCTADGPLSVSDAPDGMPALDAVGVNSKVNTAGSIEIEWPGGRGRDIEPGEEKLAFAEFEAFPATAVRDARGSFTYRVLNPGLTLHREIVAEVIAANVDVEHTRAWFIGVVISDSKECGGGGCGGHDGGGCSGGGAHDDGGCSGGGTHDDGGCSGGGTDGGTDSGCTDGTHDDGGCSGGGTDGGMGGGCSDGTHDDGGCSGGGTGGGGHSGGGSVPGNLPRVGQFVVVKLHDLGTPGVAGDRISWKWFAQDDADALPLTDVIWPQGFHLCPKTIIGGNLKVHTK